MSYADAWLKWFDVIDRALQEYLDDAGGYAMTNTAICIGASAG